MTDSNSPPNVFLKQLAQKKLMTMIHDRYLLDVFEDVDDELSKEIQRLWLKYRLLPKDQNWDKRAKETCTLLLDKNFEIIGLSSCFVIELQDLIDTKVLEYGKPKDKYYCFRVYIHPRHISPVNPRVIVTATFNIARKHAKGGIKGIITKFDNDRVIRKGILKQFQRSGGDILTEKSKDGKVMSGRKFSAGALKMKIQKPSFWDRFSK